jgi:crotonobetaine/carnitine-CoA ligase
VAIEAGASVALFPRFSRSEFWSQISESGATGFLVFVSILEMLWAAEPSPADARHGARFAIVGHVPAGLGGKFEQRFGVELFDIYGLTEADPISLPRTGEEIPAGSCGKVNPDFDLRIWTADASEAPAGELGEIVVRPHLDGVMMRGYADEAGPGGAGWEGGWFRTGDIGRLDEDGFLYFAERKGDLIRVRGENVSPHEVELVLFEHPAILDVGVLGIDSALGEHEVKAFVVTRGGVLPDGLETWCEERMAKFMVPRHVVVVEELPRTDTGKVRRELLRKSQIDLDPGASIG